MNGTMNGTATGLRGFGRTVATTAACNLAAAATVTMAGIVIARSAGPSVRGEYAEIMAWFGLTLSVGQLGLSAATTFFVARHPTSAPDYLATSRTMMLAAGAVTAVAGVLAAPLLAAGSEATLVGHRLMFGTCLVSFLCASYTFSLQASSITQWNLVRISQPVLFAALVIVLCATGHLGLMTALVALSMSTVVQTAFAYSCCFRQGLTGGRASLLLARPMTRYGLGQLAASVPSVITARLDQLALSLTVAPAVLGHYAAAASVTTLAMPVVSALGSVAFPRLAARILPPAGTARLQRLTVAASAGLGLALMLLLMLMAPWLIPVVFGASYRDAILLCWLLAPGGVLVACGQVCADLLRGHGRPLGAARAQAAGAGLTILLLAALVPLFGAVGAAIGSSTAAGLAPLLMFRMLRDLAEPGS